MMWEGIHIKPGEIPDAFSPNFSIERTEPENSRSSENCCVTAFLVSGTGCAAADISLPKGPINEFHRTQCPACLRRRRSSPCEIRRPNRKDDGHVVTTHPFRQPAPTRPRSAPIVVVTKQLRSRQLTRDRLSRVRKGNR
jgi:hypothetical protein